MSSTIAKSCHCRKRLLECTTDFGRGAISEVFCPDCMEKATADAIAFELTEPGEFQGLWAIRYDKRELREKDEHFRDAAEYFMSLLISGVCGPTAARHYSRAGLSRILGVVGGI